MPRNWSSLRASGRRLLLGVDGVLAVRRRPGPSWVPVWPRLRWRAGAVYVNPAHGPLLMGLVERVGVELAWCTDWGHEASRLVAPLLGLPEALDVVYTGGPVDYSLMYVHSETSSVARYMAGHPFVWISAETTGADRRWLKERAGVGPFRLVVPGYRNGLAERHLKEAEDWFSALKESDGDGYEESV